MKKIITSNCTGKTFIGIFSIIAILCFLLTACHKNDSEKKISGTVIADNTGTILFKYSPLNSNVSDSCTFTTNLPAPNDRFILRLAEGETTANKYIYNLEPNQKVQWTATVEGMIGNSGSGNFVHITNN
ncbi:MAG: hypothetical protein LBR55_07650 [Bacteroidales bacterium]|jgi:hypothetical protein|nr:hypothetical protein [Bacteroidales bacterium]